MHRELLDALSVITEKEQRILDEQRGSTHSFIQRKRN